MTRDEGLRALRTLTQRMRQRGEVFHGRAPADPEIMSWVSQLEAIDEVLAASPIETPTDRCGEWLQTAGTRLRCHREAGHDGGHHYNNAISNDAPHESYPHRCSGCGLRWHTTRHGSVAAELCGDCWRKVQPILHGALPSVREPLDEAVRSDHSAALVFVREMVELGNRASTWLHGETKS